MKSTLVALLLIVALITPSKAMHCGLEPDRCKEGECCVEFGLFARCRPLKKEGEQCEFEPGKSKIHKDAYMMKCPCAEGLTCKEDGSGSILQGKCAKN